MIISRSILLRMMKNVSDKGVGENQTYIIIFHVIHTVHILIINP